MSEGTTPEPPTASGSTPPARPGGTQPDGMGEGWASLSTLIGGMAVWGGVGYLLDGWLGTAFFVPTGVLVGMVAAIYLIVKKASPHP